MADDLVVREWSPDRDVRGADLDEHNALVSAYLAVVEDNAKLNDEVAWLQGACQNESDWMEQAKAAEAQLAAMTAELQAYRDGEAEVYALRVGLENYRQSLIRAKDELAAAIAVLERINGRAQVTYAMQNDNVRALLDIRLMCAEALNQRVQGGGNVE